MSVFAALPPFPAASSRLRLEVRVSPSSAELTTRDAGCAAALSAMRVMGDVYLPHSTLRSLITEIDENWDGSVTESTCTVQTYLMVLSSPPSHGAPCDDPRTQLMTEAQHILRRGPSAFLRDVSSYDGCKAGIICCTLHHTVTEVDGTALPVAASRARGHSLSAPQAAAAAAAAAAASAKGDAMALLRPDSRDEQLSKAYLGKRYRAKLAAASTAEKKASSPKEPPPRDPNSCHDGVVICFPGIADLPASFLSTATAMHSAQGRALVLGLVVLHINLPSCGGGRARRRLTRHDFAQTETHFLPVVVNEHMPAHDHVASEQQQQQGPLFLVEVPLLRDSLRDTDESAEESTPRAHHPHPLSLFRSMHSMSRLLSSSGGQSSNSLLRLSATYAMELYNGDAASQVRSPFLHQEHCEKLQERFHLMTVSSSTSEKVCPTLAAQLHVPIHLVGGMYNAKTQWFITALADSMLLTNMYRRQGRAAPLAGGEARPASFGRNAEITSTMGERATSTVTTAGESNGLKHFLEPKDVINVLLRCCREPERMLRSQFRGVLEESTILCELGATKSGAQKITLTAGNHHSWHHSSTSSRIPCSNSESTQATHFTVEWYDFALLATVSRSGWYHAILPLVDRYFSFPPLLVSMRRHAQHQYHSVEQIREHLLWVAQGLRPSNVRVEDFHAFLERRYSSCFTGATAATSPDAGGAAASKRAGERRMSMRSMAALWNGGNQSPAWLGCFARPSGRAATKLSSNPSARDAVEELHVTPLRMVWALMAPTQQEMLLNRDARKHQYLCSERRAARNERLLKTHVASLLSTLQHSMMHRYWHRWQVFQRMRREISRKRTLLFAGMTKKNETRLVGPYFHMWRAWLTARKAGGASKTSTQCYNPTLLMPSSSSGGNRSPGSRRASVMF